MTTPSNPLFDQPKIVPVALSSQLDDSGEERIHVAPYRNLPVYPDPVRLPGFTIYATIISDPGWLASTDGGATFDYVNPPNTPGTFIGSTLFISKVGNHLWRAGSSSGNYNWRQSADGVTWSTGMTMSPSFSTLGILWTGTSYILWGPSNTYISSTGAPGTWSSGRAIGGATVASCANKGDTLVASGDAATTLRVSTNAGTSWVDSTIVTGGSFPDTYACGLITADSSNFLAFEYHLNAVQISATGTTGSWTRVVISAATGDDNDGVFTACHADTGRWLFVARNGTCYYSDNGGTTWTQGATLPCDGSLGGVYKDAAVWADGYFYVLSLNNSTTSVNGVYRSTNGATAWQLVDSEDVDTGVVVGRFKAT